MLRRCTEMFVLCGTSLTTPLIVHVQEGTILGTLFESNGRLFTFSS